MATLTTAEIAQRLRKSIDAQAARAKAADAGADGPFVWRHTVERSPDGLIVSVTSAPLQRVPTAGD